MFDGLACSRAIIISSRARRGKNSPAGPNPGFAPRLPVGSLSPSTCPERFVAGIPGDKRPARFPRLPSRKEIGISVSAKYLSILISLQEISG